MLDVIVIIHFIEYIIITEYNIITEVDVSIFGLEIHHISSVNTLMIKLKYILSLLLNTKSNIRLC